MIRIQHYRYLGSKDRERLRQIYEESFPVDERFDFSILVRCDKETNVHLSGILLDDLLVGMQFTVVLPNDATYLMYFAIDETYRNLGIGSNALQKLVITNDNVLLSIEKLVDEITMRRRYFYLRNGLFETKTFYEDTGVQYQVLTSCFGYEPDARELISRYKCMTSSKRIWRLIKNTFNTESLFYV